MRIARLMMAIGMVFVFCTVSLAAEYYVIKDKSGKLVVVETKPSDEKLIYKGPFKVKSEAEAIITQAGPASTMVTPGGPAGTGTVQTPAPGAPAAPAAPPAPPAPPHPGGR
jgi:hypothetical protein